MQIRLAIIFVMVLSLSACHRRTAPDRQWLERASQEELWNEAESLFSGDRYPSTDYANAIKKRLLFLNPWWDGDVSSREAFHISRSRAERDQGAAMRLVKQRAARPDVPTPTQIAHLSEAEVWRQLELLATGEYSGGYTDEELANYGEKAEKPEETSENFTGRELFRTLLRGRLCDLHPEWDAAVRKAITYGKLLKGMNRDQVIASRGEPDLVNRLNSSPLGDEEWVYEATYVYMESGKLKGFTSY